MAHQHIVTKPTPVFSLRSGRIEVHQVPVWQDNLVWLLVDPRTREAIAVDGPEAGPVLTYCAAHQLTLTGIVNTHTHGDHIGINRDLENQGRLNAMRVVGARMRAAEIPGITEPVEEGDSVQIGSVQGRVMLTEGHLDGHVSYLFEDVLFCGDTLFAGGCGYLFDGPPEKMYASLQRLAALPPETKVCCAHEYTEDNLKFARWVEPDSMRVASRLSAVQKHRATGGSTLPSTIGDELETNPFLRGHSPMILAELKKHQPHLDTSNPVDVFALTRSLKDRKLYRAAS